MRSAARGDELDLLHRHRVDDRHAHASLVGDVEHRTVGGELHVDGQPADVHVARELHLVDVDLGHDTRVLGRDHQVAAVGAEVHVVGAGPWDAHGLQQLPPVTPVPKLDALQALHDVDRLGPVRREVEVVGKRDVDSPAGPPRVDVEHGQAARPLVVHVQRAHVPGRRDVVRDGADAEVVDHLVGRGVDDVDGSRAAVRHVHPLLQLAQRAGHGARERVGVDVERGVGKARRLDIRRGQEPRGLLVLGRGGAGADWRSGPHDRRHDGGRAEDRDGEDDGEKDPKGPRPHGPGQGPDAASRLTRPEDLQAWASARRPTGRRPGGG